MAEERNILLVEPFMTGSHAAWALGLQQHSRHRVDIISLPGRHWKWRMHGAAYTMALETVRKGRRYDAILATDMLDVSSYLGFCRSELHGTPVGVYFHENQLSYPWSPIDRDVQKGREFHYGFINWTTALAADRIYFNSAYNLRSFYDGVRSMLRAMPDKRHLDQVEHTEKRSAVVPLGIDLQRFHAPVDKKDLSMPVILWNHRWEYDKCPESFFEALRSIRSGNPAASFRLIVCGDRHERYPAVFDRCREEFREELLHFGYATDSITYRDLLHQANLVPVTSRQEFFGQSLMEAMAAGCLPLLPDALVYPEHVPAECRGQLLYHNKEELVHKLSERCLDLEPTRALSKRMQQYALQYDWREMAPRYDELLEELASDRRWIIHDG